jgi:RNA recognition motif-containing protein
MGYGFVLYESKEAGMNAISALNGLQIESKRLKVSLARPAEANTSSDAPESNNLYFSGLPQSFTQESLIKLVATYGQCAESKILIDHSTGLSRGVGFARVMTVAEARAVIGSLNGTVLEEGSAPIIVKYADSPAERERRKKMREGYGPMHSTPSNYRYNPMGQPPPAPHSQALDPSNLSYAFQSPVLQQQPSPYPQHQYPHEGPPQHQHQQGPAYIYTNPQTGESFVMTGQAPPPVMTGQAPGQHQHQRQHPHYAQPQQTGPPQRQAEGVCLFVYHLPQDATEAQLFSLFSNYGAVLSTKIMKDLSTGRTKGFGFVNMASVEQAQLAIQALSGYQMGNKFLKVSFKT